MRPELDETLAARPRPASHPAPAGTAATVELPSAPAPVNDRTETSPRARATATPGGLVAGQQLGHFRIERPLGAGGMGEVYLATDLALERPVAIKVLPEAVAREPARRDRLVREARAQARVVHPNVGHIYFVGEQAGYLYFAMEYVAGQTVGERLAAGPLAVDDALAIVRAAALGLREAQRTGITHRDIKPSNLMIDSHGVVKVLDFGLAASAPTDDELARGITGPVAQTSMAGTPLYMAPEQARGEAVDCRADIYALGATLYHLVAGRPPFEADTLGALLSKHSGAERPAVPRRSGQPRTAIAAVDALIGRMMAPAIADRFASYDELIRAIELASVEHTRPAGLVVRSIATLLDLLIASIAAGAIAGLFWLAGMPNLLSGDDNLGALVFSLYGLAAIALIARTGRTLGQAVFELEVADVTTGRRPDAARAARRVLIPLGLPLVGAVLGLALRLNGYVLIEPVQIAFGVTWCLPFVALLWASLRSVSKQTYWDVRSGTVVRYRIRNLLR
ncbi:MAG TPA: serine/threonine-protein kinase [Kofleriaceae bacterium]